MTAYWVLFFALDAGVRTIAPIIPFMTEKIWQDLTRKVLPNAPISVHLSTWPVPMEGFKDDGIIEQTALARDVIAAAMRLRNEQQLKVRQPLSTLFVCAAADTAGKLRVFEKNILDELNIKSVEYIADFSVLEDAFLGVNFKAAGAVLKQDVNKFKQALEAASAEDMSRMVAAFDAGGTVKVSGWDQEFDTALFVRQSKTKAGLACADCGEGLTVAIDTVLTEQLIKRARSRHCPPVPVVAQRGRVQRGTTPSPPPSPARTRSSPPRLRKGRAHRRGTARVRIGDQAAWMPTPQGY